VTTVFRATGRFALVAMLGLSVFAAFGAAHLLRGDRRRTTVVLTVVMASLVGADLWNLQAPGPTRVRPPTIAKLLAAQPSGIVAAYPITTALDAGSQDEFFQDAFGQALFNGWHKNSATESRKIELQTLTAPDTPAKLAAYRVRYVLLHKLAPKVRPAGYPVPGAQIPGLRWLGADAKYTLYQVTARPATTLIAGLSGFSPPEGDPVRYFRWMSAAEAKLDVQAACAPCVGTLRFSAGSFAVPRTLTVRDDGGRVLSRVAITGSGQTVRIPVRFSGHTILRLQIDPGPQSPHDLSPGNPDTRPLGVFVGQPIRFIAGANR
jgi:hypothetical protein